MRRNGRKGRQRPLNIMFGLQSEGREEEERVEEKGNLCSLNMFG